MRALQEAAPGRGWHCRKQVQKRTLVYFAKIKSFCSALACGSLPATPEWSGWGRRGDRSHPLREKAPFSGFSQEELLLSCGRRWVWIIPGTSVPWILVFLQQSEPR